ncbi:protein PML-like isoform X2 [Polyodon spathula]|uniref:protein PML-like isoform X2 n=1 Tax=Polyodon spathula TaxID=7913 RepID=UPI001B7DF385|nr:protein PML-like isoform X2 [Polyodon spathula]
MKLSLPRVDMNVSLYNQQPIYTYMRIDYEIAVALFHGGCIQSLLVYKENAACMFVRIMSHNSDTLQSYSQFLQCGACSCSITSPKLLSCLHSFCQTCLRDQDGSVTCPTCHQTTEKAEVKDNKLLSDLQSKLVILRQIGRGSDLFCSCCNASAGSMCFECEKFLCQKCFEAHQVFTAKDSHSVESLESLKEMSFQEFLATARKKRQPYCPDHDKQAISIFCRTCSKSICCTCTVLTHKPHDYADIKLEAQLQKHDLTQMSTALLEKEKEFVKICQDLLSLQDHGQHHKKELVEQITASVKEALRKVNQKGEALLEELESLYAVKEVEIKHRIVQMENVLRRIEASRGLVDNMITYAAWKEVMEMQDFVKSAMWQLQSEQPLNLDSEETTVQFIQTTKEPSDLLGSLVVSNSLSAETEVEAPCESAAIPIAWKREREEEWDLDPDTEPWISMETSLDAWSSRSHREGSAASTALASPVEHGTGKNGKRAISEQKEKKKMQNTNKKT